MYEQDALYCQLKAEDAEGAEIVLIVPEPCGYSLNAIRQLMKNPDIVRLFEVQDGARVWYDEM